MNVIVVGGGAAGMMASGTASKKGAHVLLLEKNADTGKKLRITGKGRCNITNDCAVEEAVANIPTGGPFLRSALNAFSPAETMEFFEALGVALKTERGNRVFPESDKAPDVVKALRRYMEKTGVRQKRCEALDICTKDGMVAAVVTDGGEFRCDAAILATGGMSYPSTGSTGDGYRIARKLGHTVTPIRGSLVPLEAEAGVCGRMQGLTLKNVRLSVYEDGVNPRRCIKPIYTDFGELLFTHFGLSGPLPLSASAHMRDFGDKKYYALIDLKPALDEKKLDARILRDFKKHCNRDYVNALDELLPKSCIPVIVEKTGIPAEKKVHSITRDERMRLVQLLKGFRVDIARPRPVEEAIVTSGGVDLREINPKTMESKLVKGLYFAGEIIDADAYTGGFNLQIAWSTGYVAGRAAAQNELT